MPVEIKELVIRAVLTEEEKPAEQGPQPTEAQLDRVVEQCVKAVIKILERKKSR